MEGGTGLSNVCICFPHLLAWGLLPVLQLLDLCNVHMVPLGLCFPGCSCWGISLREATALLATTSQVQFLD